MRGATKALEPMRDAAEANAPVLSGDLRASFVVSTRLSARQAGMARGAVKSTAEVHVGPTGAEGVWNYAHLAEFGREGQPGRFALTRAFEAHKEGAVQIVGTFILAAIEKSLARGGGGRG